MKESSVIGQSTTRTIATVYGYPRQGAVRELKKSTEAYWAGRLSVDDLLAVTRTLRLQRLSELHDAGIGEIPSNDFSLYDHVLDTVVMLGAIPPRHHEAVADVTTSAGQLDRYFAMARGTAQVAPLESTKVAIAAEVASGPRNGQQTLGRYAALGLFDPLGHEIGN